MKHSALKFKIKGLQQDRLYTSVETISIVILSLFVSALLPSLLVRYVYANQQLFEQPKLLEIIPVAAFIISVAYAGYALVSNILRSLKIAALTKELETAELMEAQDGCCGGCCSDCGTDNWSDFESFDELDKMVDEAIASSKKTKSSDSKKTVKSVTKKAASKK